MEVTRAHLQKELRTREMECERLKVHIKVVKSVEVLNMQGWKKNLTTGPLVPEKFSVARKYFTRKDKIVLFWIKGEIQRN